MRGLLKCLAFFCLMAMGLTQAAEAAVAPKPPMTRAEAVEKLQELAKKPPATKAEAVEKLKELTKLIKEMAPREVEYKGPVHPALFRIVKDKSTVYLFGSIHLLPPKFVWRTPAIEKAV